MLERKINSSNNSFEKAIAIMALKQRQQEEDILPFKEELLFLSKTANANIKKVFLQRLDIVDKATYIRKGKMNEVLDYAKKNDISTIIFDTELTGSQIRNLQDFFSRKIIDRPTLILDIFALRAKTAQAKTQVELAQYQYLLPRLRGLWKHLERQGGGIGTRGPGETEIETDRRIVQKKIKLLNIKLEQIKKQSEVRRKNRSALVQVALIGYTNVGKSSLMNLITKSETLIENKLFATLDTTTRKTAFDQTPFILSDTVGFIRDLPHDLIESFKSTLEEAKQSHILIHVIDISDKSYENHIKVVNQTLHELNIENKNTFLVFNKLDKYEKETIDSWILEDEKNGFLKELKNKLKNTYQEKCFLISVKNKKGIDELRLSLWAAVKNKYKEIYPYKTSYYE